MKWPQLVYLGLIFLSLGLTLGKHGEPQPKYNFFSTLIGSILQLLILQAGGFFG